MFKRTKVSAAAALVLGGIAVLTTVPLNPALVVIRLPPPSLALPPPLIAFVATSLVPTLLLAAIVLSIVSEAADVAQGFPPALQEAGESPRL